MDNNLKLKQSNNLILATHRMNIQQMRLFFYACSQYKGDLEINISLDDINRVLTENTGNRGGNQRELVKETIPSIMRNAIVHLVDESGEEWCSALRKSRLSNDGVVTFTFDKSIQKELEDLRGYTWMYLSQLTGMTSRPARHDGAHQRALPGSALFFAGPQHGFLLCPAVFVRIRP